MSKSKGNVVNPDDVVERFGADTLRVYEMFMGPFDQSIAWSTDGLVGARRFIERFWKLQDRVSDSTEFEGDAARIVGKAIQKVEGDIEVLKFNTAVSALMIAVKELEDIASIPKVWYSALVACVAPIVPHIAEELWSALGYGGSVHETSWPKYDEKALLGDTVTVVIQVNGKSRGTLIGQRGMAEGDVMDALLADPKLSKWVSGKSIQKTVYVQDRLMSLVVDES